MKKTIINCLLKNNNFERKNINKKTRITMQLADSS